MPHTCWQSFRAAASNRAFAFPPRSPKNLQRQWCATNDSSLFSLPADERCLSSSSLLLCLISSVCDSSPAIVCVCVSSKCHYVQVSAPAIRDHLTFFCYRGCLADGCCCHSLLVGCFIVEVNVSVSAQGSFLCSPAHFCFLGELVRPSLVVPLLQETRHSCSRCRFRSCQTRTQRGNVKLSLWVRSSPFCCVPWGCSLLYGAKLKYNSLLWQKSGKELEDFIWILTYSPRQETKAWHSILI